jgi:hypothetical protein
VALRAGNRGGLLDERLAEERPVDVERLNVVRILTSGSFGSGQERVHRNLALRLSRSLPGARPIPGAVLVGLTWNGCGHPEAFRLDALEQFGPRFPAPTSGRCLA